jgi:hypothetical protein
MSCNINAISDCTMSTGGISKIYIFPYGSLYDYEYANDNLSYIADYKIQNLGVEIKVEGNSLLREELQKGNTDVYNYGLNLTVQKMEWEKRAELFKLIRGAVTIIIKDKNGKCWLFGKDAPARVTTYNATTAGKFEDNVYEVVIGTFSKEPLKQIRCYDATCAISVQGREVRTSFFTINSASTYNFAGLYELLGDTITRGITPLTPLDPTNWTTPAILAADTATIQSIVNPNGNSVAQLAYDSIGDIALIIVYSSDTSYPFMTIGGQSLTGTVEILVNLQTTFSTLLTGVQIEVTDSLSNTLYDLPVGSAVTGTGLSGIAENSYINVSQLYPLGETFTVSVTFNETQCSFAGYTYEYEPSSVCQMINTYSLHNGRHYTCRVEEMGTGVLYRDITIVIGEYQIPLYNAFPDYTSNFASLQNSIITALSFYPDLNISNVTVTADIKAWILEFDSTDDDLDFYVTTRGDDTVTLISPNPNVRKWLSERSIVLALQTAAPSDSTILIENIAQSQDFEGLYGNYPTIINGRLEEVPPFTNAITNSIGIDISDWIETDNITVSNTTDSCPDVTNNFTIDTCLDTVEITQDRNYWRWFVTGNDLGTVIEFDTTIGLFIVNLPSNLVAGNYPEFGDALTQIPEIENANIQYNAATNVFTLEFFMDASVTVNSVESDVAGFFVFDAQYEEYRYKVTPKQHPDIQFNWNITSANMTNMLSGSCKDYINADLRVSNTYLNFEYNTGLNSFDIAFTNNDSSLGDWYVDFYYGHPDIAASQYQEIITAGSNTWSITSFSGLLTPSSVRFIRFRNDAGYEQYFVWNGSTTINVNVPVNVVTLLKEVYGRFDDCRILSTGVHVAPVLIRTSLNCPNLDPDVINFMTATGIVDPVIETALNTFVTVLKANNLWNKFYALYPFVGGTATTHKFNLKNPLDTNAALRLTFSGGWVHNTNGITGNGINTFANTWFDDSLYPISNNHHLSIYNRTNVNTSNTDMGNLDGVSSGSFIRTSDNSSRFLGIVGALFTSSTAVTTNALGWGCANRVSSTEVRNSRNALLVVLPQNFTNNTVNRPRPYFIGAVNAGTAVQTTNRNYSFASIGEGLSDAELVIVYNAIQALQTALSRQV